LEAILRYVKEPGRKGRRKHEKTGGKGNDLSLKEKSGVRRGARRKGHVSSHGRKNIRRVRGKSLPMGSE